jgi:hypothetical protein
MGALRTVALATLSISRTNVHSIAVPLLPSHLVGVVSAIITISIVSPVSVISITIAVAVPIPITIPITIPISSVTTVPILAIAPRILGLN